MIGVCDLMLLQWDKPTLCPPNLEIMKIATYYKLEENKFCRLVELDETDFTNYEIIYVFSESKNYTTVPDAFRRATNIVYGGTAFTNGIYIPFDNSVIDYTLPRPTIYSQFLKDKYIAGITDKEITRLLDNTYYRWHAGTEVLPLPPIKKRKRVYIYDIDFFQDGWREIINKILIRKPSSINFIHPAHYKRITDFLEVRENALIAKGNDAYLDLNIPLRETPILMKHYKNRLLATIVPSSQVYLSLGGSYHYLSDYIKDLLYKLNLLYIFWSQNIPLKIKYEDPAIGCYNPIIDLSKLIMNWTQGDTKNYKSILDKIPKDKGMSDIRPERIQLNMILEKYPLMDTLFRQTTDTVKKGGFWRYGY